MAPRPCPARHAGPVATTRASTSRRDRWRFGCGSPGRDDRRPGTSRSPRAWPPAGGSAIIARATRVWKGLRTVSYVDRLGSDPTHVLVTHWQAVAPDRLAYQIDAGSQAIIIGRTRWDRASGAASWQSSSAVRAPSTQPFWVSATDAHVARQRTLRRACGLARLLLRPEDAGVVPGRDRQEDAADARPPHDRDRAFHARHLRSVQRAHQDRPAGVVRS